MNQIKNNTANMMILNAAMGANLSLDESRILNHILTGKKSGR